MVLKIYHLQVEMYLTGAVCKLYFDLEFKKSINHGRDGLEMVRILIKVNIIGLN